MKKLSIIICFCLLTVISYAQVGIGTTTPDVSSALDITAANSGLLIPRVSLVNVTNGTTPIATPATSLLVWNTNATVAGGNGVGYYYWDSAIWVPFFGGANTLDQAYDEGGPGSGRIINVTDGALQVLGTDGLIITGTFGMGSVDEITGAGTRLFFNPRKAAFRTGFVNGAQWNDASIGNYSNALGYNTTASGIGSTAIGYGTLASGEEAIAMGFFSTASGQFSSVAIGEFNTASQSFTTAMGVRTIASGIASTAMGNNSNAYSYSEMAIGMYNSGYTPASISAWNGSDRLFVVGNGTNALRSNALTIFKDGRLNINDAYTLPTTDGFIGESLITDGAGTISWGTSGGGTTASNGLSMAVNNITLGGTLTSNTTLTAGLNNFNINLNSTGNFLVQDVGVNHFEIRNTGDAFFGSDTFWKDNNTLLASTTLASLIDSGDDGVFSVYRNDAPQHIIHSNAETVFNEQGAAIDFRVEGGISQNMLLVDASSSSVGIGTVPGRTFHVAHQNSSINGLGISNINGGGGIWHFHVNSSGALSQRLELHFNGTYRGNYDSASGFYTSVSDKRLKKEIKPVSSILDKIDKLNVVNYSFKNQPNNRGYVGFIAQDVKTIFPHLVYGSSELSNDKNNNSNYYTMDYSGFGVLAIKAIQEQQVIISNQQKEIDMIKAKLQAQEDLNMEHNQNLVALLKRIENLEESIN